MVPHTLAFFRNLGGPDILVNGVVALVIFGRRLPEVGRNLAKTVDKFSNPDDSHAFPSLIHRLSLIILLVMAAVIVIKFALLFHSR